MNLLKRMAMKLVKNEMSDYVQRFLLGDDVYEMQTSESGMSSNKAMKYSAVFACNRVLGETLSSLPIMEYRKKPDGTREVTQETKAYDLLHNQPNLEMSPFNFKEACMTSLNLGGNIVCQKRYFGSGELAQLIPILHQNVKITRVDGKLVYSVYSEGKTTPFSRDQVFHIPGMSYDGVIGLSPISYMAGAINLGMSYEKYGNNFYKNGALTSGTIEHPLGMSDAAFQRLKEEFKTNYQGLLNSGKPIILEEGAKYNPISITPVDAQLLEGKRFQVEDICRVYRVPLHLVQDLTRSTNNNIEHQSLEFVMYTMLPYFKRWEENINMQLLTPQERRQGYYLEINASGLLRGDMIARAKSYAVARQWGWMSVNDIRKLENMPPIPNGDIYLTPLNMYEAGKESPKVQTSGGGKTQVDREDDIEDMAEKIYKMLREGGKIA